MSETFWIVLMICVTIVLVAVFALPQLRDVLKVFKVMANKKGIDATIETKQNSDVMTGGNLMMGEKNKIDVEGGDVSAKDNVMWGMGNQIKVRTTRQKTTKK